MRRLPAVIRPPRARRARYVRDLGLIARDPPPRIANPIYAEVVPREITSTAQERLVEDAECRGRGGAM
ncbi:MAG: hypothetical protein OXH04_19650 [Acidobacteria bacterium]|nr:hypothetical protein [Acidobacteriota bacterium]